jgi:Alpha-L-arabinofuranosidase B, catalytic
MDAINFSTECWFAPCTGSGPWVQADLENGLFAGANGSDTNNTGNSSPFVTALLKNNGQTTYAIKGGNAQSGGLTTWYNGPLPNRGGYSPMHQEGSIVLGTGGDGGNTSIGSFFEGVMTAGYPSDAADNSVQANIVSAGYGGPGGVAGWRLPAALQLRALQTAGQRQCALQQRRDVLPASGQERPRQLVRVLQLPGQVHPPLQQQRVHREQRRHERVG